MAQKLESSMRKMRKVKKVKKNSSAKSQRNCRTLCMDLTSWAAGRGIVLNRGLAFYSATASGRGVRALEDLEQDDLLCLVPLEACVGHELWLEEVVPGRESSFHTCKDLDSRVSMK